jgi:hypothetical protein
MNYNELFDDFEKTSMCSNIHNSNLNNISLPKMLNCKKQILLSFRDYLKIVIKSIDDDEYNEIMINELCVIIDKYYKNIEDNNDNLSVFSNQQVSKYNDYETDSQSNSSNKNTNSDNEIILVNKPENNINYNAYQSKSDKQLEDASEKYLGIESKKQSDNGIEKQSEDESDKQSEDESDKQSEEQSEDESEDKSEDESNKQSGDESDKQSEDDSDEQSEDDSDEQSEDESDEQSEDDSDEQSEDESDEQSEDDSDEQSEDDTEEQSDSEQESKKNNKKLNNNTFFESFINNDFDINKRVLKVNPDSVLYLKNFIKESFIY